MRLFRTLSHCHNHWWLLKSSSSQWLWDYTDIMAIWYIGLTRLWWETPPFIACKMISRFWFFWFQYLHLQPRLDFIIEVILWSKVRNRDKHLELPDLRGASLLWIWIEIGTLATIRLDEWCLLVTNTMYNVFKIQMLLLVEREAGYFCHLTSITLTWQQWKRSLAMKC